MEFTALERWLEREIGLDPDASGRDEIARAGRTRMRQLGLDSVEAYLERLRVDASERDEIVEAVLVPETWFFREPGALAVLRDRVAAHVNAGRGTPFRVLSLPCATGEEPYSIAITLVEAGLPPGAFHVQGADISQRSLAHARAARYGARALRHATAEARHRFFAPAGEGFQLSDEVVRLVQFRRANLVDPQLLDGEAACDAIFCRNALMFLSPVMQRRVLDRLAACLADGGLLFTGHAEGLRLVRPLFESAGLAHAFAYRRAASGTSARAGITFTSPTGQVPSTRAPAAAVPREPVVPFGSVRRGDPDEVRPSRPADTEMLAEIARLADAGDLAVARGRCLEFLAVRPTSADAYHLRAVIDLADGRRTDAEDALRRAVYLDPRHEGALLLLARERERGGNRSEAERLRRRAARARGSHGIAREVTP